MVEVAFSVFVYALVLEFFFFLFSKQVHLTLKRWTLGKPSVMLYLMSNQEVFFFSLLVHFMEGCLVTPSNVGGRLRILRILRHSRDYPKKEQPIW